MRILTLVFVLIVGATTAARADVALPMRHLGELQRWRIDEAGFTYPGGWSKYCVDYKLRTAFFITGAGAEPFHAVAIVPYTEEMIWIESRARFLAVFR